VFVVAMVAMGLSAVGISLYEHKESIGGGALAAYFVFTGWMWRVRLKQNLRGLVTARLVSAAESG
jgi:hypothetical protein